MSGESKIIASSDHLCRSKDGRTFTLSIALKAPFYEEEKWVCPVLLKGWDNGERRIFGGDSLQALGLAMAFVRSELRILAESGGQIIDPESGAVVDIESWIDCFAPSV